MTTYGRAGVQTIQAAGRVYCYSNLRWVYPNTAYGMTYHQWNANAGTGVNPTQTWAYNGWRFNPKSRLVGIVLRGRSNNASITGMSVFLGAASPDYRDKDLAIDSAGESNFETVLAPTPFNDGWNVGNLQDMRETEIELDYQFGDNGGVLQPYFKHTRSGTTTTRYYYLSMMLKYYEET